MTLRRTLAPLALCLAALVAAPAQANAIEGNWKTDDGKSVIQFYPCGAQMCGKIARFLVPEPKGGALDDKNPDKALRSRKLLGLRIFWNLAPSGTRFKGKGYSPEDGRNFNAEVWREGNVLKVRGCVMLFCRTANFTKA